MSDDELSVEEATKAFEEKLRSEREQRQRSAMTEALADWVWVSEATCSVRLGDRRIWTDRQWKTHFAHLRDGGDFDVARD